MPPKKSKYLVKPSVLVETDDYSTDDSFGESQRKLITSEVRRDRLETYQTAIAAIEAKLHQMGPIKGKDGEPVGTDPYAQIVASTGSVSDSLLHFSQQKAEKKRPKMRGAKSKSKPKGDRDEDIAEIVNQRVNERRVAQFSKSPLYTASGEYKPGKRAKASLFRGVPRGLGSRVPRGYNPNYVPPAEEDEDEDTSDVGDQENQDADYVPRGDNDVEEDEDEEDEDDGVAPLPKTGRSTRGKKAPQKKDDSFEVEEEVDVTQVEMSSVRDVEKLRMPVQDTPAKEKPARPTQRKAFAWNEPGDPIPLKYHKAQNFLDSEIIALYEGAMQYRGCIMGIFGPHVARSHQLKLQRYAYMQLAKLLTQVSGRSRTPHEICSKIMQDRQAVRRVIRDYASTYGHGKSGGPPSPNCLPAIVRVIFAFNNAEFFGSFVGSVEGAVSDLAVSSDIDMERGRLALALAKLKEDAAQVTAIRQRNLERRVMIEQRKAINKSIYSIPEAEIVLTEVAEDDPRLVYANAEDSERIPELLENVREGSTVRHPTPPPKSGGQSQASAISAAEAYGYFMKPNLNIKLGPGKPRRNAKDTITVDSASGEEDEPPKKRVPKKKKAATDADMPGPAKTRIPKKKTAAPRAPPAQNEPEQEEDDGYLETPTKPVTSTPMSGENYSPELPDISIKSRATKAKEKQLKQQDDELRKLEAELRGGVSLGDDDQDDDGASTVQPEQPDESIEDMLGSLFKTGRKDTPEKFVEPEATKRPKRTRPKAKPVTQTDDTDFASTDLEEEKQIRIALQKSKEDLDKSLDQETQAAMKESRREARGKGPGAKNRSPAAAAAVSDNRTGEGRILHRLEELEQSMQTEVQSLKAYVDEKVTNDIASLNTEWSTFKCDTLPTLRDNIVANVAATMAKKEVKRSVDAAVSDALQKAVPANITEQVMLVISRNLNTNLAGAVRTDLKLSVESLKSVLTHDVQGALNGVLKSGLENIGSKVIAGMRPSIMEATKDFFTKTTESLVQFMIEEINKTLASKEVVMTPETLMPFFNKLHKDILLMVRQSMTEAGVNVPPFIIEPFKSPPHWLTTQVAEEMGTTARAEPGTGDENRPGPSGDRVSLRLSEDKTSWEENQDTVPAAGGGFIPDVTSEVGKEISDIVRAVVQTVAEEDAQEVKEGEVVEEGDGDDTLEVEEEMDDNSDEEDTDKPAVPELKRLTVTLPAIRAMGHQQRGSESESVTGSPRRSTRRRKITDHTLPGEKQDKASKKKK